LAANLVAEVKPINWPDAVDPTDDIELPVMTTDAIAMAADSSMASAR
jgi:hypothetical protein